MAKRPTSRGVLSLFFALAAGACSSDLFHSTEWQSLCDKEPSEERCGGGGGGGGGSGGSAPSNCIQCQSLATSSAPRPMLMDLCASAQDAYALLDKCRCVQGAPCLGKCASTPACGSMGIPQDIADCDECAKLNCGEIVEACVASSQ
jgi:hypothetical protein